MIKTGKFISGKFFAAAKYSAMRRGIDFDLSIEYLDNLIELQNFRCAYTNEFIDLKTRDHITGSLDRKDSNLPYIRGNVQFLKKEVNMCKWTLSEEEFFKMIESIYENSLIDNIGVA